MARSISTRRQTTAATTTGASLTGAKAVGARILGPSAMGPLAIAVSAIGALAIGRLTIANAVIRKLRAEQIEIGSLKVRQLEVAGQRWAEAPPTSTQAWSRPRMLARSWSARPEGETRGAEHAWRVALCATCGSEPQYRDSYLLSRASVSRPQIRPRSSRKVRARRTRRAPLRQAENGKGGDRSRRYRLSSTFSMRATASGAAGSMR
jgi:hypothetical protein